MTGDERLAVLEVQVAEQAKTADKLDERLNALDQKLDKLLTTLDVKFDKQSADLKALSAKVDSDFRWLVGINVTMWATTVAAILVVAGLVLARP